MGQVHPRRVAGGGIGIEDEMRALDQENGVLPKGTDPQLRPLQVDQHADWPAIGRLDIADHAHELAHAVVARCGSY